MKNPIVGIIAQYILKQKVGIGNGQNVSLKFEFENRFIN